MTDRPIRVRFAPSPTGFLHVGGARTALFNYLFARHHRGTFILRIEDTDLERSTEESTRQILESLEWLGLHWDEGPYSQRERAPRHREVAEKFLEENKAYRCFCTREELDAARQAALKAKQTQAVNCDCGNLSAAEIGQRLAAGLPFAIRFRVPPGGRTIVEDGLAGPVVFEHDVLGDFILLRPDGNPVYNFACAVDDVDMKITHVIRGSDHLSNTPRQVLVIGALGAEPPRYTHVPLIMKNAKKMSKRDADADANFPVSVHARRDLGYLREATVNFLALLGWSYDGQKELFSIEEAIERFDGSGLNAAAANFDEDKYTWMNAWYIRNLPKEIIVEGAGEFLRQAGLPIEGRDPAWLGGIIGLVVERSQYLRDFPAQLDYFFRPPASFDPKGARKIFGKPGVERSLRLFAQTIGPVEPFTVAALEEALRLLCDSTGEKFGDLAQPARLAITGRTATPGIFDILYYLGKEECLARLESAARAVEQGKFAGENLS